LTLVPYLAAAGELKTKPTQHSEDQWKAESKRTSLFVEQNELSQEIRNKLLFCNVKKEAVIQSIDASTIYEVLI
jgi:CTP synthase